MVESSAKFMQAVDASNVDVWELARQYVELMLNGIATAEYQIDWPDTPPPDAVLLSTAYAYLTRDVRSGVQFWLDLGSDGWWLRPNQPLTNPYVMSNRWPKGMPWTDAEEKAVRRETLGRLVIGLASRCDQSLYLGFSELGVNGTAQRGRLQRAIMQALSGRRGHE